MKRAGSGERGAGVSLVELIVALAILGLVLGVSGLALASLRLPREAAYLAELRRARAQAIRTGLSVRAAPGSPLPAPLFLPDGSARGPGVDPLTGRPHAAR